MNAEQAKDRPPSRSVKKLGLGIATLLAIPCFYVTLQYAPLPYAVVAGELFLLLMAAAHVLAGAPLLRAILGNAAVLVLLFGAGEIYEAWQAPPAPTNGVQGEGDFFAPDHYFKPDPVRGYAGRENLQVRHKISRDGRTIFDVRYTTNRHGLRITPHDVDSRPSGRAEVIFFGCSYTVGQGVNDEETIPYQVEALSGGQLHSTNLGFHGYGPQQMLRMLELRFLDRVVPEGAGRRYYGVCQTAAFHVDRASGNLPYRSWGGDGPQYFLDGAGIPQFGGSLAGSRNKRRLMAELGKSRLLRATLPCFRGWRRTEADINLYLGILEKSKNLFETAYGGPFYVLFWDVDADPDNERIVASLEQRGVTVLRVSGILKDYTPDRYKITGDDHPNALADRLIAGFLVDRLRKAETARQQEGAGAHR